MKEFDVTARSQEEGKIRPALEPSIPCPSPPTPDPIVTSESESEPGSESEGAEAAPPE